MKKLLVALAALVVSTAAHAQEARRPFGLGISIVPLESAGATPTIEVYAPIAIAPNLRVEPSLGIETHDQPGNGTDTRDVTIGAGLFYVQKLAAPFDLYMGGRLALNFAHASTPTPGGTVSDSGTDVVVAAAIGGEQYLSSHFSLGAEAQLGYRSNSNVSGDDSRFFTTGLAFLRFYF
jgi:Outer membrane protein beta-barrel domain